jgi:hypothetical protein
MRFSKENATKQAQNYKKALICCYHSNHEENSDE